jgi:hypothetical protein
MGEFAGNRFSNAKLCKISFESLETTMNKGLIYFLALPLFLLMTCAQVSAHHGSSNYDLSKPTS